jgi:hypothetical protein
MPSRRTKAEAAAAAQKEKDSEAFALAAANIAQGFLYIAAALKVSGIKENAIAEGLVRATAIFNVRWHSLGHQMTLEDEHIAFLASRYFDAMKNAIILAKLPNDDAS